ncbi:hypothetical protein ABOM_003907 [Aspergillus bombycis]|uniref:NAD-dependent epimerase/dehydratase domain-containing protein n=1 Tax=Aspergillus bombycis TaxID=109264 RepID=A0A1F8A6A4_9EURO|nr:hypothetical protein ABOM_003907 [Aspergillus bombycis]OGM47256.1 hypothetical protein ABOM_003907 [Aspergillus bombycis]
MAHNILLTGASGYLGGTLLARLKQTDLPPYGKLYALVRSETQAQCVQQYGAEPLLCNIGEHDQLTSAIIDREISVIYFLIDAYGQTHQQVMIRALGKVKERTGKSVHFLHTTGAKQFSRHGGVQDDRTVLDTDPKLYAIQKSTDPPYKWFTQGVRTNVAVIDTAEENGVRSYIFAPCIVYGEGEGFGNRISIQDVAVVKAAKKTGRVYMVDSDDPIWPVCHIIDNTALYLQILRQILLGNDIGYNRNGFFLAASGSVAWKDIYDAFAKALSKSGVVGDSTVAQADKAALGEMGEALGVDPSIVPFQVGGNCTFTPVHGRQIGWQPQYPPEHILEAADAEVELILKTLESRATIV